MGMPTGTSTNYDVNKNKIGNFDDISFREIAKELHIMARHADMSGINQFTFR
jgi:hypothetical protein